MDGDELGNDFPSHLRILANYFEFVNSHHVKNPIYFTLVRRDISGAVDIILNISYAESWKALKRLDIILQPWQARYPQWHL